MICEDEPPQENTNTNPSSPLNLQSCSFSSLPDEIVENILARVSKWYYPNLSLVSKRFLSLLSSPELYTTRSRIGTTDTCIYIFLEHSKFNSCRLFTLWLIPADETLTDDDYLPYEYYSLVPFPVPSPEPFMYPHSTIVVGLEIYLIGGDFCAPSSAVRILDCRSHTWRDGPRMLVARTSPYAVLLDEKIYVMDGCGEDDIWMEVLDIKTKTWSPLMRHRATVLEMVWFKTIMLMTRKEGTWEKVETHHSSSIDPWCVIDDVTYFYSISGYFIWYDSKSREWIDVKGLDIELLHKHVTRNFKWGFMPKIFTDGGKLLLMLVPSFELPIRKFVI